jgi:hypothetical protein
MTGGEKIHQADIYVTMPQRHRPPGGQMDDIDDLLRVNLTKRPEHPDMERLVEISRELLAEKREATVEEQSQNWVDRIASFIDVRSLGYQAMQTAMSIHSISTGLEFSLMMQSHDRYERFVKTLQAFYDGFLIGAEFERRGGHQEG